MTFKKFLKRANRGLILGLVLLIGLSIYIAVDETRFRKEKPGISQMMNEYLEDIAKFGIFPEEYQQAGKTIPKEAKEAKLQENKQVIEKYWGTDFSESWQMKKADFTREMESMVEENSNGGGFISKLTTKPTKEPSIKKNGPNAAIVSFDYTLVVEYTGNVVVNLPTNTMYTSDMSEGSGEEQLKQKKRLTLEGDASMELEKQNGEWKIVRGDYSGYSCGSPEVIDTAEE